MQEILDTGKLSKNDHEPESVAIIKTFMQIYGVGSTIANHWYSTGSRNLEDISQRDDLTEAQILGLKYYDDLNERIPRQEVSKIASVVDGTCKKIDVNLETFTGGSFRRGSQLCGDVDILIFSNEDRPKPGILDVIVKELTRIGLINHTLAFSGNFFKGIASLANAKKRRLGYQILI